MNTRTTLALGLAAIAMTLAPVLAGTAEAQSVNGKWEVNSGVLYGKLIPVNVAHTMTMEVTDDQFNADSGNLTSSGTVTADPQASPAQVTFEITSGNDPNRELKGIFKLEGQNLTITFSETDEFPTSFDSTAENKYLTLSYQVFTGRNSVALNRGNQGGVTRNRPTNQRRPATQPPAKTDDSGSSAEVF